MGKTWDILRGSTVIATVHELEYHGAWMEEEYVSVSIKSASPMEFEIGDHLEYRGSLFEINYDPNVIKVARSGSYGEGFTYDNVKLYSESSRLKNVEFKDYVLNDKYTPANQLVYSSQSSFSFFAQSVEDLADRIQANLNRFYGNGEWRIYTPVKARTVQRLSGAYDWDDLYDPTPVSVGKTELDISVQNIKCWDALKMAYTHFDLSYYVRGKSVIIGGKAIIPTYDFGYGKGNGLYEIERTYDESQQIITKLFAYGSEKNLPLNYYANLHKKAWLSGNKIQWEIISGQSLYGVITSIPKTRMKFTDTQTVSVTMNGVRTYATLDFMNAVKDLQPDGTGWSLDYDDDNEYLRLCLNFGIENDKAEELFENYVNGSEIVIESGVNINTWPTDYVKNTAESLVNYPALLSINRLMLPGFPDRSLRDWVLDQIDKYSRAGNTKKHEEYVGYYENYTFSTDKFDPWIRSKNADVIGDREGTLNFDSGDDEIYPTVEGTGYDEVAWAEQIDDNGYLGDKDLKEFKLMPSTVDGNDGGIGWNTSEDTVSISMKDGFCVGREFKVKSASPNGAGLWELTLERVMDESLGVYFPYKYDNTGLYQIYGSGNYHGQKEGDKFVILGIPLPQSFVEIGSQKLFERAIKELSRIDHQQFTYLPKIDEIEMARQHDYAVEHDTTSLHDTISAGMQMRIDDDDIDVHYAPFIDNLTIKENGNNGIPTYEVVLRDEKELTMQEKIQSEIIGGIAADINIGIGGNGNGGNAISSPADLSQMGEDIFLSKKSDDTANGLIGFLSGLWIGAKKWFFDSFGNIGANNIDAAGNVSVGGIFDAIEGKINKLYSHNYSGSGLAETGWQLTNDDGTGASLLEVDKLLVRMKATFMELEIRKETFSGGNSHYSPAGSVVYRVDFLTEAGDEVGYRMQKVPWLLKGFSFLFGSNNYTRQRRIRYANTLADLSAEDLAKVAKFRCYLISDDGTTATRNWWQVGDQPRCQSFNKALSRDNKKSNVYDTTDAGVTDPASPISSDFWWRLVTGVGSRVLDDGNVYDYIDMPYEHYVLYEDEYRRNPDNFCASGSGIPKAGDTIVCMGSRTDTSRMNMVSIISVATDYSDAPAIKGYRGIHSFTLDGCLVWSMSPAKVSIRSKSFEFIADDGSMFPVPLDRGAFVAGYRYHWYDRVSHNGCLWLCTIADSKVWVTAAGANIGTPASSDITEGEGSFTYTTTLPDGTAYTGTDHYYKRGSINGTTVYYVQSWTYDEPSDTNANWLKEVSKGTEITQCVIRYAASLDGVNPPSGQWKETITETGVRPGQYLWTRRQTYYSDNRTPTVEYSVARWGIDGDGISEIDSFYWATDEVVTMDKTYDEAHILPWDDSASASAKRGMWAPSFSDLETCWGGLGNMQAMYVWEKTVVKYDMAPTPDGSSVTKPDLVSYQCSRIGNDGQIGMEEYYCLRSSADFDTAFGGTGYAQCGIRWYNASNPAAEKYRLSSTTPNINTSMWGTSRPDYQAGSADKYLWNFEQRVDGTGTQYATKPVCIGDASRGIAGVIELYALSASQTPVSSSILVPADINAKNTYGVIPTTGFEDKQVWGDERYDRAPTEPLPYQWNWTRTLYTAPKDSSDTARYTYNGVSYPYEDHYHVSAVRGTNGEDGAGEESVYTRNNTGQTPSTPPNSGKGSLGGVTKDNWTAEEVAAGDDWVPDGWTDNPQGIDPTHQYEYVSTRKLGTPDANGRKTWGPLSVPVLRSNWGKNGVDGDGMEYVFIRTNSNVAPTIVNSPDGRTDSHSRTYLDDEYLPLASGGDLSGEVECTDNPTGVDASHQFEWVAKRTKGEPSTASATYGSRQWEKYSGTMALWHNFADDAVAYRLIVQPNGIICDTTTGNVTNGDFSVEVWRTVGDGEDEHVMTLSDYGLSIVASASGEEPDQSGEKRSAVVTRTWGDEQVTFDSLLAEFNAKLSSLGKNQVSESGSTADVYEWLLSCYEKADYEWNAEVSDFFEEETYPFPVSYRGNNTDYSDTAYNAMQSWLMASCLAELIPSRHTSGALTNNQTELFRLAWDIAHGDTVPLFNDYDIHADPMIARLAASMIYHLMRGKKEFSDMDTMRTHIGGSVVDVYSDTLGYVGNYREAPSQLGYMVNVDAIIPNAPGPYADGTKDRQIGGKTRTLPGDGSQFYLNESVSTDKNWWPYNYKKDIEIDEEICRSFRITIPGTHSSQSEGQAAAQTAQDTWEDYPTEKKLLILKAVTAPYATRRYYFGSKRIRLGEVSNGHVAAGDYENPITHEQYIAGETYDTDKWFFKFALGGSSDILLGGPFADLESVMISGSWTGDGTSFGTDTAAQAFIRFAKNCGDNGRYPVYLPEYGRRRRPLGNKDTAGGHRSEYKAGGPIFGDPLDGITNVSLSMIFATTKADYDKYSVGDGWSGDPASSYPSGHAAQSWAMAMILGQMYSKTNEKKLIQYATSAYEFGAGRTISRHHWTSDTIIGRLCATMTMPVFNAIDTGTFRSDYASAKSTILGGVTGGATIAITNKSGSVMTIMPQMRFVLRNGSVSVRTSRLYLSQNSSAVNIANGETKTFRGVEIDSESRQYIGLPFAAENELTIGTETYKSNILVYATDGHSGTYVMPMAKSSNAFIDNATYNIEYKGNGGGSVTIDQDGSDEDIITINLNIVNASGEAKTLNGEVTFVVANPDEKGRYHGWTGIYSRLKNLRFAQSEITLAIGGSYSASLTRDEITEEIMDANGNVVATNVRTGFGYRRPLDPALLSQAGYSKNVLIYKDAAHNRVDCDNLPSVPFEDGNTYTITLR